MSRADYAHWNEEADQMWWQEEGRHAESDGEECERESYAAADAFAEEIADMDDEQLADMLADKEYLARWPKAKPLIEWEIRDRQRRDDAEYHRDHPRDGCE